MDSLPSPTLFIRSRRTALLAGFVALSLAGYAAGRVFASSCPAQAAAREAAQPGLVLMAGDAGDPACAGKHRLRSR